MRGIDSKAIDLLILCQGEQRTYEGGVMTQWEEGTKLSLGNFRVFENGNFQIGIEEELLQNPDSLIATINHELNHYVLYKSFGDDNDEMTTELLSIITGWGLFASNAAVPHMKTWNSNGGSGWKMVGGVGYLSPQEWAFSLAYYEQILGICLIDNRSRQYLNREIYRWYKKASKYLKNEKKS